MKPAENQLQAAFAQFDAANAADPNTELVDGKPMPAALLYGRRMTHRLDALAPDASEAVRLAVRAQHLLRWRIPRDSFPAGRKGYHQWRTSLARYHAEQAAKLLREVGYGDTTVARVQALLRKERLKLDAESQLLEDVACLVFLEYYLADFMGKHEPEKVVDILRKTWHKMSPRGHEAARLLSLPAPVGDLLEQALGG